MNIEKWLLEKHGIPASEYIRRAIEQALKKEGF